MKRIIVLAVACLAVSGPVLADDATFTCTVTRIYELLDDGSLSEIEPPRLGNETFVVERSTGQVVGEWISSRAGLEFNSRQSCCAGSLGRPKTRHAASGQRPSAGTLD